MPLLDHPVAGVRGAAWDFLSSICHSTKTPPIQAMLLLVVPPAHSGLAAPPSHLLLEWLNKISTEFGELVSRHGFAELPSSTALARFRREFWPALAGVVNCATIRMAALVLLGGALTLDCLDDETLGSADAFSHILRAFSDSDEVIFRPEPNILLRKITDYKCDLMLAEFETVGEQVEHGVPTGAKRKAHDMDKECELRSLLSSLAVRSFCFFPSLDSKIPLKESARALAKVAVEECLHLLNTPLGESDRVLKHLANITLLSILPTSHRSSRPCTKEAQCLEERAPTHHRT
eukprot:CAMPEP_0177685438 /NCGR_PEP_ID=MMETSP0447-20121125/33038_1 /TAXON_ID=0 /ORGANISM="Stygamoeba regulata, Strain BSH-02190019" /LENGTH=290 /DNA_ID=CAMNT_0019195499 /DNA_START=563 /DNA_END=1435 /DNA_ORIENTATION=-